MESVTSIDGTPIAFDRAGKGPALILVGGALSNRSHPVVGQLATLLAPRFTVFSYDRRGRGDSGDTAPYAVEREVEDIEALIDEAGGSAFVYGVSSGAVLALEAADRLPDRVRKLALYEPPFIVDDSRPPVPGDYVAQLEEAIAAGRPGDAIEIFMTQALRVPSEFVAQMRRAPADETADDGPAPPEWAGMEKVAHTLAYDGRIMGNTMSGRPLPAGHWNSVTSPTLVLTGGNSEAFFHNGAQALVDSLPEAGHRILEGQDHAASPEVVAPVLIAFFAAGP